MRKRPSRAPTFSRGKEQLYFFGAPNISYQGHNDFWFSSLARRFSLGLEPYERVQTVL